MALTWTESGDSRANLGYSMIVQLAKIQPAASDYATGGYPVYSSAGSAPNNAGQYVGLANVHGIDFIGYTGTALNYLWEYNKTTCKIVVQSTPGTEVAASTDLSGGSVYLLVWGF